MVPLVPSPLLAVLHNPIHGRYDLTTAHLFEAEAEGEILEEGQMKGGSKKLTLLKEIPIPQVTKNQKWKYGNLCNKQHPMTFGDIISWQNWAARSDNVSDWQCAAYACTATEKDKTLNLIAFALAAVENDQLPDTPPDHLQML